jgi:hypothetical protein
MSGRLARRAACFSRRGRVARSRSRRGNRPAIGAVASSLPTCSRPASGETPHPGAVPRRGRHWLRAAELRVRDADGGVRLPQRPDPWTAPLACTNDGLGTSQASSDSTRILSKKRTPHARKPLRLNKRSEETLRICGSPRRFLVLPTRWLLLLQPDSSCAESPHTHIRSGVGRARK